MFRDAIERYLKDLEKEQLPREHFCVGRHVLCSYGKIFGLFTKEYAGFSFSKRMNFIKERLVNLIADNANRVIAKIDVERRLRISELPDSLSAEEYKKQKQQIYEQDEDAVHDLLTGGKNALKAYFKKIKLPTALECYHRLVSDPEILKKYASTANTEILSFLSSRSQKIKTGYVEYEDLAPLMYLHYRIHGVKQGLSIRHVIIDEAQDLSAFQFFVLKEVLECSSMTILGDIAQGIYSYRGTGNWGSVADKIFGSDCEYATLQKSYRSTVEIMGQANRVISKLSGFQESAAAEPVIRNGDPVRYIKANSEKEIAAGIAERINELRGKGFKNISIVCKTMRGCEAFAKLLKKYISEFTVISGKEYSGGVSIVPSYLVKGLEFDAALIADAHLYRENEMETKLLYVAMTRAMHCMDVFSIGSLPYHLENAD